MKKPEHVIRISSEIDEYPCSDLSRKVICAALDAEKVQYPCEVCVLITDDEGIHEINLEQRGVDSATDVLSFPMFELTPGVPPDPDNTEPDPGTGLIALGDMVISLERCARQADEFGHSIERELAYLTVHSVLHLLGYDHMDEGEQKARMRAREEDILNSLGITRQPEAEG